MLAQAEAALDAVGLRLLEWWAWPAALVSLAVVVVVAGWALEPGPHESVLWWGHPAFATCPYLAATGVPCGQCGTTRALVWAARGHLWTALRYNPAAFAGWTWLMAGGVVGGARLLRRDPALWRVSWTGLAVAGTAWVAVYLVGYALRIGGFNPLP